MRKCAAAALLITSVGVPIVNIAAPRVDAAAIGSLFLDAMQNTYFKDGDVVYRVVVRGVLPGDPAC